jgi:hypothetical protein
MPRLPKPMPSQSHIKECFEYDEMSGVLTWKVRPLDHFKNAHGMNTFNSKFAGKIAGHASKRGYISTLVDGLSYLVHRVIWVLMTGEDPGNLIDHWDTDKSNNRWSNLRKATKQQNGCNRGAPANSKTGIKGVSWDRARKKFFASIAINGKTKGLGRFETADEARAAYAAAAQSLHGEFAKAI